jgi:glutathione S-transferase
LCHAHAPHSLLWPQDPHQRANIDRWMDAQQTVLNRPMGVVFWGLVRTPADKRDPAAIAQGVADAAKAYGMIEPLLAKHPYIAGPDFSLADIPWGVHAHRWFNMDFERPSLPALRAWYDRLCDRPAYKQHIVACPVV